MKTKRFLSFIITLVLCITIQAQNNEERISYIGVMYKNFISSTPEMIDLAPLFEKQDLDIVYDTIPEAYDLFEKAIPLIDNMWNYDIEKLNTDFHDFISIYTQNQHKFSKNSYSHILANLVWAMMGMVSGNEKWVMDGMLTCDNYFAQQNPSTIFRCITIPQIAELNMKMGNVDNAVEWQRLALKIVEENHAQNTFLHAIALCNLANCLVEKQSYEECELLYDKSFAILDSIHARKWFIAGLYSNYARFLLSSGSYEKIPSIVSKIESLIDRNDLRDVETALQADAYLFPCQFVLDEDADKAKTTLYRIFSSISLLFKNRFVFLARQIRDDYWDSTIEPYYEYLNMAASLYKDDPDYTIKMYNAQLQYKGAKLASSISFENLIHESPNLEVKKLYEEYIENEKTINALRNSIDSIDAVERYQRNFRNFNIENELLRMISSEGSIVEWANCSYETIKDALGTSDMAIEFFTADAFGSDYDGNTYYALIVRSNEDAPHLIEVATEEDLNTLSDLSSIYNIIWRPIFDLEDNQDIVNVYFSPSGKLNDIPIEHALSLKDSEIRGYRLSSTRELLSRNKNVEIRSAALFGGVVYDNSNPKNDFLPESLKEIKAVNKSLRSITPQLYTGLEATEKGFKELTGNSPNIILLSTHGGFSKGGSAKSSLKNTYLKLSGCDNLRTKALEKGEEDGFLHASEIEDLDLRNTNIVVLSACQSGLGNIGNEGVYGLQRGFKKAGVKSILMTLWDVEDKPTRKFVSTFFDHFSKTQNKYESYNIALKEIQKKYKDYKIWGAFVLMDAI